MKLLIVESPNKCKKLKSILGEGWTVKASAGHIRDLPTKEIGVEAPSYKPRYIASGRSKNTIADLKRCASKASVVYLATDLDREGEAIAWHLKDVLKLRNYHRVTFQEITSKAVLAAIANTRDIDMNMVYAQETRRVIDRLVGYKVSGVASRLTRLNKMSAGRVQSPCTMLVVIRENEIKLFKPTSHYLLNAHFTEAQCKWSAQWNISHLLDDDQKYFQDIRGMEAFRDAIEQEPRFKVKEVSSTKSNRKAPAPFTTASLQQCASTVLGLDPDETMKLAQSLFESGKISYHRTDAVYLSDEAVMATRDVIRGMEETHGQGYLPRQAPVFDSGDNAQEAHESIRPTDITCDELSDTGASEQKLYSLIRNRTIASQMAPCVIESSKIKLISGAKYQGKNQLFEAKGLRTLFLGWRILGDEIGKDIGNDNEENEEGRLPELNQGDIKETDGCDIESKKTKAPPRYTQASLIKKMEKEGIGRPSTYANILKNIMDRGYIEQKKGRKLWATERGIALIESLTGRFMFMDLDYTRKMEKVLDFIANGKKTYLQAVQFMDTQLNSEIKDLGISTERVIRDEPCEKCGKEMIKRPGKNGDFWGCSGWPKCKNTAQIAISMSKAS